MKNLFRLSTGIVFIVSILVTVGCYSQETSPTDIPGNSKVKIYIRLHVDQISGEKYLEMCDPQNFWVKDSLLETYVKPGDKVKWILVPESGIKEILEIKGLDGKIFKKNPSKIFLSKNFKFIIPDDVEPGEKEEYYIRFKIYGDNSEYKTDPMLRVPPDRSDGSR
jgi:hypothetical protein